MKKPMMFAVGNDKIYSDPLEIMKIVQEMPDSFELVWIKKSHGYKIAARLSGIVRYNIERNLSESSWTSINRDGYRTTTYLHVFRWCIEKPWKIVISRTGILRVILEYWSPQHIWLSKIEYGRMKEIKKLLESDLGAKIEWKR